MSKIFFFKLMGFVFLITGVFFLLWAADGPPDVDPHIQLGFVALILSVGSFYSSGRHRNKEINSNQGSGENNDINYNPNITTSNTNTENSIPQACPHCKSPNNKRLALCEYCGNPTI